VAHVAIRDPVPTCARQDYRFRLHVTKLPCQVTSGKLTCDVNVVELRLIASLREVPTMAQTHDLYHRWIEELWNGSSSAAKQLVDADFPVRDGRFVEYWTASSSGS
jgi:hypothetical protein